MRRRERDRRELGFFEHLDELRARIIRVVIYVCAGGLAGWVYRVPLLDVLRYPAEEAARQVGVENLPFRVFEPAAGFVIAIQISLLAGVLAASPLILWEIWRFIEPALENHERRYAIVVVPAAVGLFLGGVAFCYQVSPRAFAFLFGIDQSLGVEIERTLKPYLWFMMRLLLAFGLAFELPLVMMFLGVIGVVNSKQLLSWWRQAVVLIFVFAAIVTPTVDPINMTILAGPMIILYLVSIVLVRMVQRSRKAREDAEDSYDEGPDPYDTFYGDTVEGEPEEEAAREAEADHDDDADQEDEVEHEEYAAESDEFEDTYDEPEAELIKEDPPDEDAEIPGPAEDADVIDAEFRDLDDPENEG